jgi:hypothetical protein
MRRCLPYILCLTIIAAALYGCHKTEPKFVGMVGPLDFHGLKVTLPQNGMGMFTVSCDSLEWKRDSVVIFIKDVGEGHFEIRTNGVLLEKAKKGEHVRFFADGQTVTKME